MLFLRRPAYKFFLFLIFILSFLSIQYFLYKSEWLEWSQRNFLLFILIQIDLLILLFLLYLIFRYLFNIFWNIRGKRISRSLKFKLIAIYVLSITFPTFILILGSFFFLKKGIDYWFEDISTLQITSNLLKEEDLLKNLEGELLLKAYKIRDEYISKTETIRSKVLREQYRYFLQLDSIEVYTYQGELYKKTYSSQLEEKPGISPSIIEELLRDKKPKIHIQPSNSNLLLRVFILVQDAKGNPYILSTGKLIEPKAFVDFSKDEKYFSKYLNLFLFLSFSILFFLTLYLSIWVGNKLGKRLTEPLESLILAIQRFSRGKFDLENLPELSHQEDEIARLINSFKTMAQEIKRYEETLKRYNYYLGGVLNALPVGILIIKENLEPFFLNQTFKKWIEFLNISNLQDWLEKLAIRDYLKNLDLSTSFYKVFHLSEIEKELFWGITFLRLDLFEESLFLLIVENLQEKEVLKRLSLWREVAIKIAHEIKNPLTPIRLSMERLQRRLEEEPLSEENRALLSKTVSVVNHYIEELRKLALDLYYFSQKPLSERSKVNILKNIEEVLELYQLAYSEIELVITLEEDTLWDTYIKGDPSQLKRVWINLFDNSIKAMGGKGKIELKIRDRGEKIEIIYEDSGPGIHEDIRDAFNKRDFQALQKRGTGFVIIAGIVELHGGEVWLEENPTGGSRVRLVFPKV